MEVKTALKLSDAISQAYPDEMQAGSQRQTFDAE